MPEAIVCRFCDRGICSSSFKNCPRCSEMIWTAATYCRYCKSSLPDGSIWGPPDRNAQTTQKKTGGTRHLDEDVIEKIFERVMRKVD